ncbi:hypothetical protein AC579_10362 [Pseudocercospora musae]|uniref:NAD(P)-binding protein n=1 Tax=Pseudocercospora musae TaxID=113226 RepID=A0A139ID49_9PEZI|nr:hypothetical protein AC579_10362 [Pseudocercospora musae]
MSIIERSNPLNLQYNVCLVTAASSPLGVRVCKSLLKANAMVLGIDNATRDSTLNAGLGTHFQFEELDIGAKDSAGKVVSAAKEKFGLERVDLLVNIVDERQHDVSEFERLTEVVVEVMRGQGKGSVIILPSETEPESPSEDLVDSSMANLCQDTDHDLREILLLSIRQKESATGGSDTESKKSFEAAKLEMNELRQSKEQSSKLHELSLLILFLAGRMSDGVTGRIIYGDGASSPM